jgi:hypothetical protein
MVHSLVAASPFGSVETPLSKPVRFLLVRFCGSRSSPEPDKMSLLPDMSSAWWEKVTQRASIDVQRRGLNELWAERTLPQGLVAAVSRLVSSYFFLFGN